jgi:hypothetical protein
MKHGCLLLLTALLAALAGCAGRAEIFPNSDKNLRKTAAQFAADAAKRFPYKSDAPRGGEAVGRAQVGYTLNTLEIINLSEEDWTDVEVWVNQSYVVFIPVMERGKLKRLPFQALYNDSGNSFPLNNRNTRVETVEVYRDGKMYDVRSQMAD